MSSPAFENSRCKELLDAAVAQTEKEGTPPKMDDTIVALTINILIAQISALIEPESLRSPHGAEMKRTLTMVIQLLRPDFPFEILSQVATLLGADLRDIREGKL